MTRPLTQAMADMLELLPLPVEDLRPQDWPVVHALIRRKLARAVYGSPWDEHAPAMVVRDDATCPLCHEDDGECYCKYEAEEP